MSKYEALINSENFWNKAFNGSENRLFFRVVGKIMHKTKVVLIATVTIVLGGVFVYFFTLIQNQNKGSGNNLYENKTNQNSIDETRGAIEADASTLNCQEDWEKYQHDVFGIRFCYPASWGKVSTEYVKNITRLSTLKEDAEKLDVHYENSIDLKFENNEKINIRIFNDQNSGKSERGIDEPYEYYDSGMTSDVVHLRNNGNICDYTVNYSYRYSPEMTPDLLNTIYSSCSNGVKTLLTKEDQFFWWDNIGKLYTYDLRFLSFKKLINGYFDNAIISAEFDHVGQIRENFSNIDEFFAENKTRTTKDTIQSKTQEQLNQERAEFQNFVQGITVFKPIALTRPIFSQIPGEDSSVTTIRKYYWLIAGGQIDQAYAMHSQKPVDFTKYQEWYKDVVKADPRDFKKTDSTAYEFYVDYQEHNNTATLYHVTMQVVDGQLKTIASEEITSEIVSSGSHTAFAKSIGDQNYMVLTENGSEIIIDKAENDFYKQNIGRVRIFSDPEFSPSGRYLKYVVYGWEWSGTFIYDVTKKRPVADMDGPETFGFTKGDTYAYGCMSPGMGGGVGAVFSLPDGKKVFDIYDTAELDQYTIYDYDCEYAEDEGCITFTLKQDMGNSSDVKQLRPDKVFTFHLKD